MIHLSIKYGLPLAVMLLMFATGCKTPAQTTALQAPQTQPMPAPKPAPATTEVLTIILKAYYNTENKITFAISDVIKKEGYFKNINKRRGDNYFKAIITNKQGNKIDSTYFENPLNKHVEYADEAGKIATAEIKNKEDYAGLRFNYAAGMSMLHIYDKDGKELGELVVEVR